MAARARSEADERAELLAWGLADFERFCRGLVWIVDKAGKRTTLKPNPIQRKYNARRTWRDFVLKPRQIGFSTNEFARDVFKFLQPGQRILVICQTDKDQTYLKKFSADIDRMIDGLVFAGLALDFGERALGRWSLPKRDSFLQIIESGASEAAASKKGRGGTLTRVHSTEAAFYEHPELTLNSLLESVPMLPDTEVVFESTPNGVGNWFHGRYVAAQSDEDAYTAHFFAWYDDPTYRVALRPGEVIEPRNEREQELVDKHDISPEQLKWYRQKVIDKGQDLVDQEYASDPVRTFLQSGRTYFEGARIDEMAKNMKAPIETKDDLRVWHRPNPREKFVLSVDPAEGLGEDGDWSVGTMWGRRSRAHAATIRNQLRPKPLARAAAKLGASYGNALIVVERNKGLAVLEELEELGYPNIYYDHDGKPGLFTSETLKVVILEDLANAIREGALHTDDISLISEFRGFVINANTGKPYAPGKKRKGGIGDDGIMSAALGWRVMLEPQPQTGGQVAGKRSLGGGGSWSDGRGW